MIPISKYIQIPDSDIVITSVRSQGAGGQNINKVSTAIHLRFDIHRSALPAVYKKRLLTFKDKRITRDGVVIIKAQRFRTQEKNREDALYRLQELIRTAGVTPKKRRPTRPTLSSQKKRLDRKTQRGKRKALRRKVSL